MSLNLDGLRTEELLVVYQKATGKHVKKFESRAAALRRVADALVSLWGTEHVDHRVTVPDGHEFDRDRLELVKSTTSRRTTKVTKKLNDRRYVLKGEPSFKPGTLRAKAWDAIKDKTHGEALAEDKRYGGVITWFVKTGLVERSDEA